MADQQITETESLIAEVPDYEILQGEPKQLVDLRLDQEGVVITLDFLSEMSVRHVRATGLCIVRINSRLLRQVENGVTIG